MNLSGQIVIGDLEPASGYRLSVDGKIASEEILVDISGDWPDYVFEPDYDLLSLDEVKAYIRDVGHLPGLPGAEDVETSGIELGEMNRILVQKIEELTLYILDQDQRIKDLSEEVKSIHPNR
jgi:hypothetical protein